MARSKKKRINQVRSEVTNTGPRTRDFVECNCLLHCNGSKMVDPRTFNNHMEELKRLRTIASGSRSFSRSADTMSNPIYVKSPSGKERKRKHRKKNRKISVEEEQDSPDTSPDTSFSNDDDEPIDIPKK